MTSETPSGMVASIESSNNKITACPINGYSLAIQTITMPISFSKITQGVTYSRQALAELWGYASFHAIARGVVTPRDDNKIILFVTEEKQSSAEQYTDRLSGNTLEWEGPTDHFAEDRMLNAKAHGEEIHLFYRERHHSDFTYCGRLKVLSHALRTDCPSHFKFSVL